MSTEAEAAAAAAFFATKKKKKKKGFKFNANKVDISQITSSTHVDAPEVSSESNNPSISGPTSISTGANTGGDWDENALSTRMQASTLSSTGAGGNGSSATTELLDMKTAYESKRNEKEEIKEKLRVEETKAQLAAAREGMKKREEKLKEEEAKKKEKKEGTVAAKPVTSSRFGVAAGNMGGSGGTGSKWLPPHMRASANANTRPIGLGRSMAGSNSSTGFQKQVNTNDEELFPDLATAKKIDEEKEEQKQIAARRSKPSQAPWAKKKAPEKKEEKEPVAEEKPVEVKETPAPAPIKTAASVAAGLKKKKKKKKDLSTFKA